MGSRTLLSIRVIASMVAGLAAVVSTPAQAQTTGGPLGDRFRRPADFQGTVLSPNDDGSSSAVVIGFLIDYFGAEFDTTYVNNNGNLTFGAPLSSYTPNASYFGGSVAAQPIPIIAPFFADVDTRGAGSSPVTYGQGTVAGRRAFMANYENVGYYSANDDLLNSFQVVLIDRSNFGAGAFDIEFNYNSIQWETGDASGGVGGLGGTPAFAGASAGTGVEGTYFVLPGSGEVGGLLNDNQVTSLIRANNGTGRVTALVRGGAIVYAGVGDALEEGNLRAATRPNDPVAGSPSSAFASMSFDDFALGTGMFDDLTPTLGGGMPDDGFPERTTGGGVSGGGASGAGASASGAAGGSGSGERRTFGRGVLGDAARSAYVALQAGVVNTGDADTTVVTAPIAYRFATPSRPLGISGIRIQMPITYTSSEYEGSTEEAVGMSFGVGVERDMWGPWSIVPAVRAGFVKSSDNDTGAITYGASLTNKLTFGLRNRITIGNVISYYEGNDSNTIADEAIPLDIEQLIVKTGVVGQRVMRIAGRPVGVRGFAAHTFIEGDESFVDEYLEFGVTFASRPSRAGFESTGLEFGVKGVVGDDTTGVFGTVGLRF